MLFFWGCFLFLELSNIYLGQQVMAFSSSSPSRTLQTNHHHPSPLIPSRIVHYNCEGTTKCAAQVNGDADTADTAAAAAENKDMEDEDRPSIHPFTIDALTKALTMRAQADVQFSKDKKATILTPLRPYSGAVDPYDIMMTAGKLAQDAVQAASKALDGLTMEESQVIGGRIVALINRVEELEDQLIAQAAHEYSSNDDDDDDTDDKETRLQTYFGVIPEEFAIVRAQQNAVDQWAKLGAAIEQDPSIAQARAACLLALFLEKVEGPGLRANNVQMPCMDVDFLEDARYKALFQEIAVTEETSQKDNDKEEEHQKNMADLQKELDAIAVNTEQQIEAHEQKKKKIGDPLREANNVRPSLHPLTINIIAEALRVRAKNDTAIPLRILNDSMEGWEITYHAGKLAERAIEQRQEKSKEDGMKLTKQEASLVGGRVVATVLRLEDLEWELLHRCKQVPWIAKYNEWDNFGIMPDESCIKTLDERILSDPLFTVNRAERLLALFLLNLEGPGVRAAGDTMPDGSHVDFLEEDHYQIMLPK